MSLDPLSPRAERDNRERGPELDYVWSGCEITCFCYIAGTDDRIYSVHEHDFASRWLWDVNRGSLIIIASRTEFVQELIGLITVSDVILTGRQSGQKLQCLYGNPMAKNFFQNRILRNL